MTADKHTPGPWEKGIFWNSVRISAGGKHIADVYDHRFAGGGNEARDENASNGCLIAAAPDMLAALVEIIRATDAFEGEPSDDVVMSVAIDRARAAIAKARGEG